MLRRLFAPNLLRFPAAPVPTTHPPERSLTCSPDTESPSRIARVVNASGFDFDAADLSLPVPTHPNVVSSPTIPYNFVRIINASAKSSSLSAGEQTHSAVIKLGLRSNLFISSALVDMYCKCHRILDAKQLFDEMTHRNEVAWNSLIRGYSQSQFPIVAMRLFAEMIATGVSLSPFSISSVLLACSLLRDQELGTMVHCVGVKHGFYSNIIVGTSLVDMYSKCSDMDDSRRVFDEMGERNVVTWTSLITGYAALDRPDEAMITVREMRLSGVRLNEVTYSSVLSSLLGFEGLDHGKQIHCLVIREGLESDPYVSVALTTMYSRCGSIEDFAKTFLIVSAQDQISHNSIIAGFSHLGNCGEVLEQFIKMRRECIDTDYFTFASLLRAIGILSALEEGRQTHALVFKTGYASTVCVLNGLVAMYAKCGAIDDSKLVFSSINGPDLVSWNSLLSGCAQHGHGREAIELFERMRRRGVKPDNTTYLTVLSACSHVGLLDKGLEYFDLMKQQEDPTTTPGVDHYSCMVDLLGRAGYLNEAESLMKSMPIKPGPSIYRSLVSACQVHGNVDIATRAAECLLELCPNDSATFVLLSNVFADKGCWDDAAIVRKLMTQRGVRKKPGWSWIEA